ncbi:MAG: hypothetical protein ACE5GX_20200, partial [Thermoanaerobaculia bacterium]
MSPESQTVPYNTPTLVETHLEGFDPSLGTLPSDLRVLADFTGPEVDGILTLETVPNEPFRIPGLSLKGDYQLDNIRLVQGDELLGFGSPRSAAILVTQILVTRVTSRALTLDEIRALGIVIDEDSFRAFNFTFGFGVEKGETIEFNFPVLLPFDGDPQVLGGGFGLFGGGTPRFDIPQLAPFQLDIPPEETQSGTFVSLARRESAPPIYGAIVFPTEFALLNQFFSVVLHVQNGAPEGDPLVLRDLTAKIKIPGGLREAETEPPTPLGVPVPIRVPGPDGRLGTSDDITFLVAQATGEAEFLLEGRRQGAHIVEMDIEGTLEGLVTGVKRVTGTARGAVVVRDPTFGVTISHPDVVRKDEEYILGLTVSNTSNLPANLVTIRMPNSKLAGVELVDPNDFQRTIETILPGESEIVEFEMRSRFTGRVTSAASRSEAHITPTFDLRVGVGENGIPLSPDELVLPRSTDALPPLVVRRSLALLGLGHSLATAGSGGLAADLPRVTRALVKGRVYQMAQAGEHIGLGEDPFDSLAVLAAEWNGARDAEFEWDRLRRTTNNGRLLAEEFAKSLAAEAEASSHREMFDRWTRTTAFLPPMTGVLGAGEGTRLEIASRTSGKLLQSTRLPEGGRRDLPYGELYDLGDVELATFAVPEDDGYEVTLRNVEGNPSELHVLLTVP